MTAADIAPFVLAPLAACWWWLWRRARVRLQDVDAAWRQVDALLAHRRQVATALGVDCDGSLAARAHGPARVADAEAELSQALAATDVPQGPRADLDDVAARLGSTLRVHSAEVTRYEQARRWTPGARWLGLGERDRWPSDP